MKRVISFIFSLSLLGMTPALAQTTAAQTVPGSYATAPQTNCTVGPCFLPNSAANPLYTSTTVPPSGTGLTPSSTAALAANQVVKASAGSLYSYDISADSTLSGAAWWIMFYNATSAPVDGTVTPLKCIGVPSGTTSAYGAFPTPIAFSTGIVIGVSTTGCFTKTASTHAFISGDAQ